MSWVVYFPVLKVKVGTAVGKQWSETNTAVWGPCWLIKDCMHCHFQYHLQRFNHVGQKVTRQQKKHEKLELQTPLCAPGMCLNSCKVERTKQSHLGGPKELQIHLSIQAISGFDQLVRRGVKSAQFTAN